MEWTQVADQGVVAKRILAMTPENAIRPGDRLVEINDIVVKSLDDYNNVLELYSQQPFADSPTRYSIGRGRFSSGYPGEDPSPVSDQRD